MNTPTARELEVMDGILNLRMELHLREPSMNYSISVFIEKEIVRDSEEYYRGEELILRFFNENPHLAIIMDGGRGWNINADTERFYNEVGFTKHFVGIQAAKAKEFEKGKLEDAKINNEIELLKASIEALKYKKGMRPVEKWVLYGGAAIAIVGLIKSFLG